MALVDQALKILLGGIFIAAGLFKWADPVSFQASILHLDFFPAQASWCLASTVPLVEVLAGLMCLTERYSKAAVSFLLILTGLYTLLLIIEFFRGINPDCGCFGRHLAHWPYWALLGRNFILLIGEAFLIFPYRTFLRSRFSMSFEATNR